MKNTHILILGGGSGGISVAARLRKQIGSDKKITIVEPSETHYFQPLWTLVGAGAAKTSETFRPMAEVMPKGVDWLKDSVAELLPRQNQVRLKSGDLIQYDWLVVATGLILDWDRIKGAKEALGKNGVHTIYTYEGCIETHKALESFKGGTALFTFPPVPIKCAGAPQKIMYLADEIFRRKNLREKVKIVYATAGAGMFGIPVFKSALEKIVERKGIEPLYFHKLIEIKAAEKVAVFESSDPAHPGGRMEIAYDFLHLVPPQRPHDFVVQSELANHEGDQKPWLKVDRHSLQNPDFKNVFGVGDVTGVPNSKTGAAIRKMAPVLVQNMLQVMRGEAPTASYDGYSSCPLVTSFHTVMLAEFGYDGKLMPSFPLDPTKERWSMWILKRYILPQVYWHGMLKGRL